MAPARARRDPAGVRRVPGAGDVGTAGEVLLATAPPVAERVPVRRAAPRFRLGAYIRATFEVEDWRAFRLCGMDEVGRGAFAGPLVAAAVVLPRGFRHPWLRDSKKLTAHQREVVATEVHRRALACAVAEISVADINLRGLGWANVEIFRRLVAEVAADGYCCDGRLRIDASHPVHCLVRGDDLIPSISAASIVAKVHRDALMRRLHLDAPDYDWDHNKGYGAPAHRAAILARGVHPEHRRVFIDNLLQLELSLDLASPAVEACPRADPLVELPV